MSQINKALDDDGYDATTCEDGDDQGRDGAERWCFHLPAPRYVFFGSMWPSLISSI
jgi:hypothetical protein